MIINTSYNKLHISKIESKMCVMTKVCLKLIKMCTIFVMVYLHCKLD